MIAGQAGAKARALDFLTTVRGAAVAAGVLLFVALLFRGTAEAFVYDAANYWYGGQALLTGGDSHVAGRLDLRGYLSILIYLPALVVAQVFGDSFAGPAVLVQNAALVAVLAVVIVPRLVRLVVVIRPIHMWLSALLSGVLLSGFVPYPLMDLWAIALVLLGIVLLSSRSQWWVLVLGGLTLGAAVNIRPSYLVPVVVAAVVWLFFHFRTALWPILGVAVAIAPQIVTNRISASSFLPMPVTTFVLANLQSQYASYIVRYDTLAFVPDSDPRLTYCYPEYSQALVGAPLPSSAGELAASYAQNLPQSLLFMLEKIGAAFHWSWATPYAYPASAGFSPLTLLVVLVSAIGFFALVRELVRRSLGVARSAVAVLLAVQVASVATLAFTAPETRFALPALLVGLVGCLVLVPRHGWRPPRRWQPIAWVAGALALAVLLLVAGLLGVAHPAAVGEYSVALCARS